MRLAALYIFENHLFKEPVTLNFGGKYLYDVTENPKILNLSRTPNENYINDFFDASGTLLNISAVVGSNGAGKTTMLYEIIEAILQNRGNNVVIFENGDTVVLHNFMRVGKPIRKEGFEVENVNVDVNTVYYSPFLDFKAELPGIDLSFDNILGKDLSGIFDLAPTGGFTSPKEILKQANYKRFRNLKVSDSAKIIKEIFDFPDDNLHRVSFTRYRIDADSNDINFHNTPESFRPLLRMLFAKIRNEADSIRNSKRDTGEDMFYLQKNLLKNYILMDVFCILIKLMEIENTYLLEGHLKTTTVGQIEIIKKGNTAQEIFEVWFADYYYSKGNRKNLPDSETIALLDWLFSFIDKTLYNETINGSEFFSWDSKSIFLSTEQLDELYKLEQNFINSLSKYYARKEENSEVYFNTLNQIPNYINLEPSRRNLSSGESSMLNLFSRIHEYFDNKLVELSSERKYQYYLVLLDEGDLGFHPIWKRQYVTVLVRFAKEFFKKIGAKVQIIFTTHDSLTLSDLPNNNIVFVHKTSYEKYRTILNQGELKRPKYSFGANLTDLLAESFFLEDSLMGDFARNKIQKTIDWLNNDSRNLDDKDYHKKLIDIVDEPILNAKLKDMYFEIFKDEISQEQKIQHLNDLASRYGIDINLE